MIPSAGAWRIRAANPLQSLGTLKKINGEQFELLVKPLDAHLFGGVRWCRNFNRVQQDYFGTGWNGYDGSIFRDGHQLDFEPEALVASFWDHFTSINEGLSCRIALPICGLTAEKNVRLFRFSGGW